MDVRPFCPHGPAVLLEREVKVGIKRKFWTCAAFRDGKECPFFHWGDLPITEKNKNKWKMIQEAWLQQQREKILENNELASKIRNGITVKFCHQCQALVSPKLIGKQYGHEMIAVSKADLKQATQVLKPLNENKKEAQYHFNRETLDVIVKSLKNSQTTHVLCIGAPRVFEHVRADGKMKALLLDFDMRLSNFYSIDEPDWIWYNMFNHHFFLGDCQKKHYDAFLSEADTGLAVVTDPPFGGKAALIAHCLRNITKDLSKEPKMMWVFPYFMEPKVVKEMPGLKMSDFQVEYDNHSTFKSGCGAGKKGSPVRIFTNIPLNLIKLGDVEGYKECKECDMWVFYLNDHCKKCGVCTAKNGGKYKHCDKCSRCVKETWVHCKECGRCALEQHPCKLFLEKGLEAKRRRR